MRGGADAAFVANNPFNRPLAHRTAGSRVGVDVAHPVVLRRPERAKETPASRHLTWRVGGRRPPLRAARNGGHSRTITASHAPSSGRAPSGARVVQGAADPGAGA